MAKLSFSGHDTFYCRHFWLKKGVDYVLSNKRFSEKNAVVELGVGKNMVSSIRFWLKAFDLLHINSSTKTETLSKLAKLIFTDDGYDPYLENIGTLWLLHYQLVTTQKASIYSLMFNHFRKERILFTREQVLNFLLRICAEQEVSYATTSIKKDIGVFLRNYLRPNHKTQNIEDDFSSLFIELDLVKEIVREEDKKTRWYTIESEARNTLPIEIILFTILDNPIYETSYSISFSKLLNDENGIGSVFALNPNGLLEKIESLTQKYPFLVYTDDAGIRELQFKEKPDKWNILKEYYNYEH